MAEVRVSTLELVMLLKIHQAVRSNQLQLQLARLSLDDGIDQEKVEISGYLRNQDWFFDLDREGATRVLSSQDIEVGTYLVRPSSIESSLVLSVKTSRSDVAHAKIDFLEKGGCTADGIKTFPHIVALIDYYKGNDENLKTKLKKPLPREESGATAAPEVTFDDFEATRSDVKLEKGLGSGAFGEVFAGRWKNTEVAVKVMKTGMMSKESFLEEAKHLGMIQVNGSHHRRHGRHVEQAMQQCPLNEERQFRWHKALQVMHKLKHDKLVLLLGVCTDQDPIYIITELMPKGDLESYLREDAGQRISVQILVKMAEQITCGMAYLETQKFVHRDLRSANVLVGQEDSIRIADFGLARKAKKSSEGTYLYAGNSESNFPWPWASPEILKDREFTTESDVWSMGVLLYELCTFAKAPLYPLEIMLIPALLLLKLDKGWRLPHPQHEKVTTPDELYHIMKECWAEDPKDRPSFKCLHHMFCTVKFEVTPPRSTAAAMARGATTRAAASSPTPRQKSRFRCATS